jgi:hypothetical protein
LGGYLGPLVGVRAARRASQIDLADLFDSDRGRPSVPTDRIAVAMVGKELVALSDRQATTALG